MECLSALGVCTLLGVAYVASLYIWKNKDSRNHPSTIKRRFLSVLLMAFLSPCFVLFATQPESFRNEPPLAFLLGFRLEGLFSALLLPLALTAVLFAGPIVLAHLDGIHSHYLKLCYWTNNLGNLLWLRNHLVAPFSEEFTFRACMLPILVPCLGVRTTIFVCPLFFGIAHLHHMIERLETNSNLSHVLLQSIFQFIYTTLFGIYSTFLFLRTGHFASSFIVHSFCNHMGFPDFSEVLNYPQPMRFILSAIFVAGLVLWILLLDVFTQPHIYHNHIYWNFKQST